MTGWPCRSGIEREDLEQGRQEARQALVVAQQLGPEHGVLPVVRIGLGGHPGHRVGGELQLSAADVRGDRAPQLLEASGRRVKQHEHCGAQPAGSPIQFGQLGIAARRSLCSRVASESSRSVTWSSTIRARAVRRPAPATAPRDCVDARRWWRQRACDKGARPRDPALRQPLSPTRWRPKAALGLDQAGGCQIEQDARALSGRPRSRVKPLQQLGLRP